MTDNTSRFNDGRPDSCGEKKLKILLDGSIPTLLLLDCTIFYSSITRLFSYLTLL